MHAPQFPRQKIAAKQREGKEAGDGAVVPVAVVAVDVVVVGVGGT